MLLADDTDVADDRQYEGWNDVESVHDDDDLRSMDLEEPEED
jgi:hypothetical protein